MWCPDDVGGIAGIWATTWETMIQLPTVGWTLFACQNGASPGCVVVVCVIVVCFFSVVVVLDTC